MSLDELQKIQQGYAEIIDHYDASHLKANRYFGIGGTSQFRQEAVRNLNLNLGDVVIDLGCGTGLNFPFLEDAIGKEGRIIGVDLTKAMLGIAEERAKVNDWKNIELIQADAAEYRSKEQVDGVLASLSLYTIPDYKAAIRRCAENLKQGKVLSVFDVKLMEGVMWVANPVALWLTRKKGGTYKKLSRRSWEEMDKYFDDIKVVKNYFGLRYLAWGKGR